MTSVSSQVVFVPGSMSISANVGVHGSSVVEVQAWISNDAWLPSQHSVAARSATRWSFAARSSRSRKPVSCQIVSHLGADDGMSFCQNPGARGAVGEPLEVQRPVGEVRQHRRRDPREVAR